MIKIKGNIFDFVNENCIICIPTNGVVNSNGYAVMGAGLALAFKNKYPDLPRRLGTYLLKFNVNKPYVLAGIKDQEYFIPKENEFNDCCLIVSFPTKNNFKDNSDLSLIENSAVILTKLVNKYNIEKCYLPRVGAGLGKLDFNDVENVLSKHLDDRFFILTLENNENA